jgi:hypothetical protein
LSRVKVVQVPQQEAGGVADLAIHIRHLLEDVAAQGHVGGVVHRRHPQPQHVRAVGGILLLVFAAIDDDLGIHHVAQGLAHLAPLLI